MTKRKIDAHMSAPVSPDRGVLLFKACCSCGCTKPVTEYLPSKFHLDGFVDRCRPCILAASARDRAVRDARKLEAARAEKPKPPRATSKCCKECRVRRPLSDFARHGGAKDGHRSTCKTCSSARKGKVASANEAAHV